MESQFPNPLREHRVLLDRARTSFEAEQDAQQEERCARRPGLGAAEVTPATDEPRMLERKSPIIAAVPAWAG